MKATLIKWQAKHKLRKFQWAQSLLRVDTTYSAVNYGKWTLYLLRRLENTGFKNMTQGQKCEEGARRWRNLSLNEKQEFKRRASQCQPSAKDRRRMWRKSCKAIMKHQKKLATVCGTEVFTIMVQKGTHKAKYFGSPMGETFLEEKNKLSVVEKFQAYVTCHEDDEEQLPRRNISVKVIQDLFNAKYAHASQTPQARMPYKLVNRGVTLTGLPDGVPFKKPILYGPKQRRAIWQARDSIKCVISTDSADS